MIKINFIFPSNYNLKNKLFGFIDYSTVILNVIWGIIIFFIVQLFCKELFFKVFLFIILFLPIFLFSILGLNDENLLYLLNYVLRYLKKPKVYLYY